MAPQNENAKRIVREVIIQYEADIKRWLRRIVYLKKRLKELEGKDGEEKGHSD